MRVRGIPFQQVLLGAALVAALLWNLAHAAEIKDLRVDSGATGTRAELALDGRAEFKVISLENPHRLVVDLPGTQLRKGVAMPAAAGLVKSVRSGQPVAGTTRIVFDLHGGTVALKPRMEQGADGARLVLEWPGDGEGADPIAAIAAATSASATAPAASPAASGSAQANVAPGKAAPAANSTAPTTPAAPPVDPSAASADATSRLIAAMRQEQADAARARAAASTSTSQAPPPGPPPSGNPSSQRAVPPSTASVPPPSSPIPTTVATGVPTPMPGAEARAAAAKADVSPAEAPVAKPRGPMPAGTRPLVIAIDAGHGGQDPGAVGPTGKREKDITLAIARELARQVNATPGLKAYLVRDGDQFIALPQRAQRARAAKADMFISVHADAAENRNAKGSSVYVLSLKGASSQRARWLADKENASDLIGGYKVQSGDVLANVLLDLTQSGQMKASEDAGNHILSGLKRIGNNHKPNIERANFAVLRTSDMPAMLVETAFLSNADEEKRLVDPTFQRTLATAILDGVNTYFTSQPPPGTLYAVRAASAGAAATSIGASGPP